jgi:hypothetical protein
VAKNSDQPKFGIKEAAKAAKVNPTYLRAKLRNAKIKRHGKSYGWDSKASMLADLKRVAA